MIPNVLIPDVLFWRIKKRKPNYKNSQFHDVMVTFPLIAALL